MSKQDQDWLLGNGMRLLAPAPLLVTLGGVGQSRVGQSRVHALGFTCLVEEGGVLAVGGGALRGELRQLRAYAVQLRLQRRRLTLQLRCLIHRERFGRLE